MYAHKPTRGNHELDVTSYWPDHHDWGFLRRNDRPDVLFEFLPRAKKHIPYPDVMFFQGKIVIDEDHNPIVDWSIPFCLSSQVEGGRLEAMARQNGNKITKDDFKARMPPANLTKEGKRKAVVTSDALGMRRLRFRDRAGLLAFDLRMGSESRKRAIIQCIPAASMVNVLLTNSTRDLTDLSTEARNFVSCTNRGVFPEKAGNGGVTAEQRKVRQTREDKLLGCFEPPNPTAWPYDDDIMDDRQAIATARAYLAESLPVGPDEIASTKYDRDVEKRTSSTLVLENKANRSQDDDEDGTIDVSRGSSKRPRLDEHHQGRYLVPNQSPAAIGSRRKNTPGSSGRRDAMKSSYYRRRKDDRAPAVKADTVEDFLAPFPSCSTPAKGLEKAEHPPVAEANTFEELLTPFPPFSKPAIGLEKAGVPPVVEADRVEDFLSPFHTPAMNLEKAGGTPAVDAKTEDDLLAPATDLEDLTGVEAEVAQFLAEFPGFSDTDWDFLGL
ncbi:MAG: hypothetical protein LQ350_006138 [Teloschistes chrysophthalmus]|nr:MAG: hypothetical protein LQ350_006138 [Niorma chrysophthalma]